MNIIAAALLIALAACAKRPFAENRLHAATRGAAISSECSRLIPLEWSASLPVPSLDHNHLVYRLFFFGRDGNPRDGFVFHRAEGFASLSSDGRVLACSRRQSSAVRLPPFIPKPGMSLETVLRREDAVYDEIEGIGSLYAARRALSSAEKGRVAALGEAFSLLIQNGQGPDYYAASPDFWKWVVDNGFSIRDFKASQGDENEIFSK